MRVGVGVVCVLGPGLRIAIADSHEPRLFGIEFRGLLNADLHEPQEILESRCPYVRGSAAFEVQNRLPRRFEIAAEISPCFS